jgi:parallel beta-helix repeat protein
MSNVTNGVVESCTITDGCGVSICYVECSNIIIRNNIISNNYCGILIAAGSHDVIVEENEISYNIWHGGIRFGWNDAAASNTVRENNIHNNERGIYVGMGSSGSLIYHNNFTNNAEQVHISMPAANIWDDGYPSGGNYWSDYAGVDLKKGPNQNEHGSDGIGDTSYVIDANNRDRYPFMSPWTSTPPVVIATLDIEPDTLNLGSKGRWITGYVELPEGYNAGGIDVSLILLNETIPVDQFAPTTVGDSDGDGVPDLMVKFDRAAVSGLILSQGITSGNVVLTITGRLCDGAMFEGSDIIAAIYPV